MSLRERRTDAVHRAATGTRPARTLLTPVGVAVFGGFTALFGLAGILVDSLWTRPKLLPESARLPPAIPTMATGLGFAAWSAFHFLRAEGTPYPSIHRPDRSRAAHTVCRGTR